MTSKEMKKILFSELSKVGFRKNSGNEVIRKADNFYQIVYFQKSNYGEDFYISLGMFIPEINNNAISIDESDYNMKQIIGLIEGTKMNEEKIKKICDDIVLLFDKEFNREKIEKIKKAAQDGDFEEYYFDTGPTFRKYLGIDE